MATVLAVSSFVARGSVGLRAVMPALDRLGHTVIACPTTMLSNHLGHRCVAGAPVALETFTAVLEAIAENGWLADVDAVLTGYMPSAAHVAAVAGFIDRVRARRPDALVVCDPVLGDLPGGLYVPPAVAEAVRDTLVGRATHVKPNLFELSFLSGRDVRDMVGPADVVAAARGLSAPVVLASSIPLAQDRLANVVVTPQDAALCAVAREECVPHGTGDLLSALFAGHLLCGLAPADATAAASAGVAAAIAASRGADELRLSEPEPWHAAGACALVPV